MTKLLSWINKLPAIVEFVAFYTYEVVASNLRVAHDVLTPTHRMRPAMITIHTEGMTDRQLLALANLITMTPGTLSVDLNEAGSELLIHAMYAKDPAKVAKDLEENYIRRVRRVF